MQDQLDNTLLILDDDTRILETMELVFEDRVKQIITLSQPEKVIDTITKDNPDLLIMDMNYSVGSVDGMEGLNLLSAIRKKGIEIPIVVMTAYGELDLVVKCMKLGAYDFIQKPWSNQRLLITVFNALESSKNISQLTTLKAENEYYKKENLVSDFGMIGSSNAMNLLRDKISRIAESDANVLILGENGTGKELVANAIHQQSLRKESPFIKIDLGSIHEQLFESEMFGAKKGTYTGQLEEKVGRITLANSGTLFLDEIGNLPLAMQAKILSVLQNREILQVGATTTTQIDIRLISATNLSFNKLLNEDIFRQDLLYRINTVEIQVPSLRERIEDIPELIQYFVDHYKERYKKGHMNVHHEALEKAKEYPWPGNVRELRHAVERAVLMSADSTIRHNDLIPKRSKSKNKESFIDLNIENNEKKLIEHALRLHQGNMTKAASDLGLTRAALYRRLEKYKL